MVQSKKGGARPTRRGACISSFEHVTALRSKFVFMSGDTTRTFRTHRQIFNTQCRPISYIDSAHPG